MLPVDYAVDGPDVVIRVGEGLFHNLVGEFVAFEVEDFDDDPPWSVLIRGLAQAESSDRVASRLPPPRVAEPGRRLVRIRSDFVTGRRLGKRSS